MAGAPREITGDFEPATPVSNAPFTAPFPGDTGARGQREEAHPSERTPLLARESPVPPFRETPVEQRRGLWPIRLSFFFATVLLFVSSGSLLLIGYSTVHPAISAVLPTHRGSTLLPAWLAVISAVLSLLSMLYFAAPRYSPVRTAYFFNGLLLGASLIMLLLFSIDEDSRTRESGLTACMLGLLVVTTLHSYIPPKVLPQVAFEAYEQRRRQSWMRSVFSVVGVTLPLFILHILLFAAVLLLTWDLALRVHDATLPPMGRLIDVRPIAVASGRGLFDKGASLGTVTFRIHLWCEGGTKPGDDPGLTVLLESDRGHPGTAQGQWAVEAVANRTDVRVCRWDRPAYGFSDAAPSSELPYVAQALYEALHNAGELVRLRDSRGLILIGNGYGSLVSRVFAHQHQDLIHSALFADAETELTNYPGPQFTLERFFRKVIPDLSAPLGIRPLLALILHPSQRAREARRLSTAREGLSATMPRARLQEHRSLASSNSVSARALRSFQREARPPARRVIVLSQAWRVRDAESPWSEGQSYLARSVVGEGALVRWSTMGNEKRPKSPADRRTPLCETPIGRIECSLALMELLQL